MRAHGFAGIKLHNNLDLKHIYFFKTFYKVMLLIYIYIYIYIREKTTTRKKPTLDTAGPFKVRYYNHTSSFRNPEHKHSTELSKYIWQLKQSNIQYSIRWKILKKCKAYSNKTKRCKLCLHEKFIIIYYPKLSSLNSRNELISACRHRKKFLLCSQ
jgi:hypothetical protein